MISLKNYLPLIILLFLSQFVSAQQYTISGKITGNNESLPFASVYLKGTTKGVNSNDEGNYCREYTQTIVVDGKRHTGHGTACRDENGTWNIID